MKSVKLEVFNGVTKFQKEIKFNSNTGIDKIVGTCIYDLFQFNDRLKKHGATYLKANDNLSIVISSEDNVLLDSYTLNSEYGFKLKFGSTAKSKRKFALRLSDLMIYATKDCNPRKLTLEEAASILED